MTRTSQGLVTSESSESNLASIALNKIDMPCNLQETVNFEKLKEKYFIKSTFDMNNVLSSFICIASLFVNIYIWQSATTDEKGPSALHIYRRPSVSWPVYFIINLDSNTG
jgi:hypothetical protein